jgi:hypothetical protein
MERGYAGLPWLAPRATDVRVSACCAGRWMVERWSRHRGSPIAPSTRDPWSVYALRKLHAAKGKATQLITQEAVTRSIPRQRYVKPRKMNCKKVGKDQGASRRVAPSQNVPSAIEGVALHTTNQTFQWKPVPVDRLEWRACTLRRGPGLRRSSLTRISPHPQPHAIEFVPITP